MASFHLAAVVIILVLAIQVNTIYSFTVSLYPQKDFGGTEILIDVDKRQSGPKHCVKLSKKERRYALSMKISGCIAVYLNDKCLGGVAPETQMIGNNMPDLTPTNWAKNIGSLKICDPPNGK